MALAGLVLAEDETLARARASGAAVLAIRVAGAGLAYAVQVLLARLMGKVDYGVFATVSVLILLLGHGSLWGLGQSVCRFVPLHRAEGRLDLLRGFLTGGTLFSVVSGFATAAVGGGLLLIFADRIGPDYVAPLALALAVIPLFALQDYAEGVARSFSWTTLAIAPPYVLRQALVVAAMLAFIELGARAEPRTAVAAVLLATAATLAVQARLIVPRVNGELPLAGPRAYAVRDWARTSLPIAFVDFTVLAFGFVDVLLLSLFVSPAEVAIYFAATRILQFVAFVPYAASAATAQRFAEAHARGDHAALAALATRTARLAALGTVAVGAGVLAASPLLLALFGPGFAASVPLLAVLALGLAVQSAFGPGEDLLNMLGAERTCALVSLGALIAAVGLNLVLIPALGTLGAAIAMALAGSGRSLALALAARRRLGVTSHILGSGAA